MSVSTSVSDAYISVVYQVLFGPLCPGGIDLLFLGVFLSSATGNLCSGCFFLFSMFLIMSPVTATIITTVTVVFSRASPITLTYSGTLLCGLSSTGSS